jgi:hypothetical protein
LLPLFRIIILISGVYEKRFPIYQEKNTYVRKKERKKERNKERKKERKKEGNLERKMKETEMHGLFSCLSDSWTGK